MSGKLPGKRPCGWFFVNLKVSIRYKILGAFIIVIAVAVLAMAFTSRQFIGNVFERYSQSYRTVVVEQWEYVFRSYYQRHGSWEGVEQLLTQRNRGRGPMPTMPQGQAKGGTRGVLPGEGLILAEPGGRVLLDSDAEAAGETLSTDLLDQGVPIVVGNETVGILVMHSQEVQAVQTLEEQFNHSLFLGVFWGGIVALLAGAVLSFLLSDQVTRPLAQLTSSALKYARRDYRYRLQLQREDEVGKLAQAFNQMADSLEKNEKVRRNLLADVSHELRTPVTILQGNFEALQSGKAEPTPQRLSSLYDEVLRLGRLVSDMEAINLAEAGKLPLDRRYVDVAALVARAAGAFQHEANERNITLQSETVPETGRWYLDEDRLVQVLINLLANAFKFTPDGGRIILRARQEDQNLCIEVLDSGPGIPPGELPFLFERFYKVRQGRGGGSGLGLSIAKSFVEAHGGSIHAANRPQGGSIFSFTLPPGPDSGSDSGLSS